MADQKNTSFGPTAGLVDEMYERYRADPSSVAESWRDFFADYGDGDGAVPKKPQGAAPEKPKADKAPPPEKAADTRPEQSSEQGAAPPADEPEPIRGAAARIVANMEASLAVPTATSVRTVPARLLEVNRKVLNGYLGRTGQGKVSFTHLIGYASVQAVQTVPNIHSTITRVDHTPVNHRPHYARL